VTNRVLGNYGTNASGTAAVPNDEQRGQHRRPSWRYRKHRRRSTANALPTGGRNVISGNSGDGIVIYGSGASGNTVAGNYIGVNAAGMAAIPNNGRGVNITFGASSNTIGGTATYARNVISGNALDGVRW
jgi:titin